MVYAGAIPSGWSAPLPLLSVGRPSMRHSTGDRFGPYETLASIDASNRQQSELEANEASARVVPSWLQPVPVRQCRAALFVHQDAHFSADKKSIEVAIRPRQGLDRSVLTLPFPGAPFRSTRRTAY
jgi:hypothetical protein